MVLTVFLLSGCSDSILNLTNPNAYDNRDVLYQRTGIGERIECGIWRALFRRALDSRLLFIFDLLGNDAQVATALQGELAEFAKYTFNPTHGKITNYWRSLYRIVMRANLIIDRSENFYSQRRR